MLFYAFANFFSLFANFLFVFANKSLIFIPLYYIIKKNKGGISMLSYDPLWRTLLSKHLKKSDLVTNKIISTTTLAKLGKNQPVNAQIYDNLCNFLNCKIEDIVEHIPNNEK